ncbi:EAL domain-containing protein [uncultured Pseudacidovorax sp.]|uniref:putative bifunctional diguanylate cyclase/phosphodiesterase n=1 Tax=uncultured Pseudacidovorax sp. TaxID=679313 RepID=UPI0025CF4199|nr:EAL domain-containing protein [uncultured Pseudacidovorax sp.]
MTAPSVLPAAASAEAGAGHARVHPVVPPEPMPGLEPDVHAAVRMALKGSDLHGFARHVLEQLGLLMGVAGHGVVCAPAADDAGGLRLLAATGPYAERQECAGPGTVAGPLRERLRQALARRSSSPPDAQGRLALYVGSPGNAGIAVWIDGPPPPAQPPDAGLLGLFCANLGLLLHHRVLLERLHDRAYQDPLVPLPNRVRFIEKVDACVHQGARDHILALVDVDDFSAANDVMGHRFGDRLLEVVARRLADALPRDVLLARVGSDTFGVLGPAEQVRPQALLDSVRHPLAVESVPHKVTLTCGWVRLPGAGETPTGAELLKDATIALKRAKRDHRGQHLQYLAHMGAEARSRAVLLSDLRAALERQQLFLVYQPQLDLASRALIGLEALLRWRTDDGHFIPPSQFIPVAEHSGLIVAMGAWVLATACRTMRELLDEGLAPQRMAVNVSMAQLQDPAFTGVVQRALAQAGIEGRHLELEITESVAVLPTGLLESTLQALRAQGISIAIDDFGTGYSSLSYLERLPLDRIKIDRTFVRQLGEPRGGRIAEMVAQLGRRLGLQVLAEGIEDAQAWQALQAMGCQEGQGFHIAMPMDKAALRTWLLARG